MLERLKQNHFWWYQGPMVVWALALFTESSIPGNRIPGFWVFSYDKVIHFLIYVVCAVAVNRGIRNQSRFPLLAKHHLIFTIALVSAYGATDEWHQYFVPKRNCSLYDWMADTAGGIVVALLYWLKSLRKPSIVS
jgi:VanZ family protein